MRDVALAQGFAQLRGCLADTGRVDDGDEQLLLLLLLRFSGLRMRILQRRSDPVTVRDNRDPPLRRSSLLLAEILAPNVVHDDRVKGQLVADVFGVPAKVLQKYTEGRRRCQSVTKIHCGKAATHGRIHLLSASASIMWRSLSSAVESTTITTLRNQGE